jgi:hypothetical protein
VAELSIGACETGLPAPSCLDQRGKLASFRFRLTANRLRAINKNELLDSAVLGCFGPVLVRFRGVLLTGISLPSLEFR